MNRRWNAGGSIGARFVLIMLLGLGAGCTSPIDAQVAQEEAEADGDAAGDEDTSEAEVLADRDGNVIPDSDGTLDPPSATEESPFGFVQGSFDESYQYDTSYQHMRDLGVHWDRPFEGHAAIMWDDIETEAGGRGVYDFSRTDAALAPVFAREGIHLYLSLPFFNRLYGSSQLPSGRPDPDGNPYPTDPAAVTAYGAFVQAIVNRYRAQVHYWMVGQNEFDDPSPLARPLKAYSDEGIAELLKYIKAACAAIREVAPEGRMVLGGSVAPTVSFLRQGARVADPDGREGTLERDGVYFTLLNQLGAGYDDLIIDYHFWPKPDRQDYRQQRVIIDHIRQLRPGAEIWNTESGAVGGGLDYTERQQAEVIVRAYVYALAYGQKKLFWTNTLEYDWTADDRSPFDFMGLINNPRNTDGLDHRKLAYFTYKKMVEMLDGVDWGATERVQEADDLYVYKLIKGGQTIWVAWNDADQAQDVAIAGIDAHELTVTQVVPKADSGADIANYESAFSLEVLPVQDGRVTITLEQSPVFLVPRPQADANVKTDGDTGDTGGVMADAQARGELQLRLQTLAADGQETAVRERFGRLMDVIRAALDLGGPGLVDGWAPPQAVRDVERRLRDGDEEGAAAALDAIIEAGLDRLGPAAGPDDRSQPETARVTVDFTAEQGVFSPYLFGTTAAPYFDLAGYTLTQEAGFKVIQIAMRIPLPQDPADPSQYDFAALDQQVGAALAVGVEPMLVFTPDGDRKPADLDAYATFAGNVVRHLTKGWGDHGQAWALKAFRFGNEPDNGAFWHGTPEEFYETYAAWAKALQAVDASFLLSGPGLMNGTDLDRGDLSTWVSGLLSYCQSHDAPIDFFSVHAYSPVPFTAFYESFRTVQAELERYPTLSPHFGCPRLANDEWNLMVGELWSGSYHPEFDTAWVAAHNVLALTSMIDAGLTHSIRYGGPFNGAPGPSTDFPLTDGQGNGKPAYFAFQGFNQLAGTTRLAVTGSDHMNFTAIAGKSGNDVVLVLANYDVRRFLDQYDYQRLPGLTRDYDAYVSGHGTPRIYDRVEVELHQLPWDGARQITLERYLVDDARQLELVETRGLVGAASLTIGADLTAPSVQVIRFRVLSLEAR